VKIVFGKQFFLKRIASFDNLAQLSKQKIKIVKEKGQIEGIDGEFGHYTTAALRAYQNDKNLCVNGILDIITFCVLQEDIRFIQFTLNHLGYNCGNVDGAFGPVTTAAVKDFQAIHELKEDGQVGPITRTLILKEVKILQNNLTGLGYYIDGDIESDGWLGVYTAYGIRKFQKDYNLHIDEIYGPETETKMKSIILSLQNALREKKYYIVDNIEDGFFGNSTIAAVKNFQKDNSEKSDGIADKLILQKILMKSSEL